jgi:hypothetical protein
METVLCAEHDEDAVRAVDSLAAAGCPVAGLRIESRGAKVVELVTGGAGYERAAAAGALSGALLGVALVFGAFGAFAPQVPAGRLAAGALLHGAGAGCVLGWGVHVLLGGRSFSAVRRVEADRHELLAPEGGAARVRGLLREAGLTPAPPPPPRPLAHRRPAGPAPRALGGRRLSGWSHRRPAAPASRGAGGRRLRRAGRARAARPA